MLKADYIGNIHIVCNKCGYLCHEYYSTIQKFEKYLSVRIYSLEVHPRESLFNSPDLLNIFHQEQIDQRNGMKIKETWCKI